MINKTSSMQQTLVNIKVSLAASSFLFFLFNSAYSYGFMLVERYRQIYPPEISFGNSSGMHQDMLIGYIIVSASYAGYVMLLKREQGIYNQLLSLLLLSIVLYQTGVYSFITDRVPVPGDGVMWASQVISPTVLSTVGYLRVIFWVITIILVILQVTSIWQEHQIRQSRKASTLK